MKITVEKKKKSVVVLDWGRSPFGIEESACRGKAFIPDGFTVETTAARRNWIAKTRVVDDAVQYRFIVKEDPTKCSEWKKSPTGAFKDINERIKNRHYTPGANGALFIGVTYPPIQKEIIARFGKQLGLLQTPSSKSLRSQRYDEPAEENQPIYGDEDKPRAVKSPSRAPFTPEPLNKKMKPATNEHGHPKAPFAVGGMFEPVATDSAFFDGAIQDLELFFGKPEEAKATGPMFLNDLDKHHHQQPGMPQTAFPTLAEAPTMLQPANAVPVANTRSVPVVFAPGGKQPRVQAATETVQHEVAHHFTEAPKAENFPFVVNPAPIVAMEQPRQGMFMQQPTPEVLHQPIMFGMQ